jgi:hypothetical protein
MIHSPHTRLFCCTFGPGIERRLGERTIGARCRMTSRLGRDLSLVKVSSRFAQLCSLSGLTVVNNYSCTIVALRVSFGRSWPVAFEGRVDGMPNLWRWLWAPLAVGNIGSYGRLYVALIGDGHNGRMGRFPCYGCVGLMTL